MAKFQFCKAMKGILPTLALGCALSTSCDGVGGMYSHVEAWFVYSPAPGTILHTACTEIGEFCKITEPAGSPGKYRVEAATRAEYITKNQTDQYFKLGMGGLIVGISTNPDMGTYQNQLVCFDAFCPNCSGSNMKILQGGVAQCQLCKRKYSLNNQGMVSEGEDGRALYRLYCSYSVIEQKLVVNNR